MDGNGSGLCPVTVFSVMGVEPWTPLSQRYLFVTVVN